MFLLTLTLCCLKMDHGSKWTITRTVVHMAKNPSTISSNSSEIRGCINHKCYNFKFSNLPHARGEGNIKLK